MPAGCSSPSPASTSTATTYADGAVAAGAAAVLGARPIGRADRRGRRPGASALGRLARARASTGCPTLTVVALTGSRARPAPRTCSPRCSPSAGADGRDRRHPQQRARRAAHRAARRPPTPGSSSSRWAPAASATSPTSARSPARRSPACSTSAPRTSASSAAARPSRAPRASSSRRLPRRRGRGAQRRRPAGGRDGRTHRRPGSLTFGEPTGRRQRGATSRSTTWAGPSFDARHDGGAAPRVALRQVGEHQVAQRRRGGRGRARGRRAARRGRRTRLGRRGGLLAWRMEVHERADGVRVVNDAYNANPDSMRAALETLAAIGGRRGRRTVAVLGEMRELGEPPRREHRRDRAARRAPRHRRARRGRRGGACRSRRRGRRTSGRTARWSVSAGRDEALAWLRENCRGRRRRAGQGVARRRAWSTSPTAAGSTPPSRGEDRRDESDPARRRPRAALHAARHPRRDPAPVHQGATAS